jgi:hypothetical protein
MEEASSAKVCARLPVDMALYPRLQPYEQPPRTLNKLASTAAEKVGP